MADINMLLSIKFQLAFFILITTSIPNSRAFNNSSSIDRAKPKKCQINPLAAAGLFEGLNIQEELGNVKHINSNPTLRSAILKIILNETRYDSKSRPNGTSIGIKSGDYRVHVNVTLVIRNIENVDDTKMDYKVQLDYRQSWYDCRLAFGEKPSNKQDERHRFLLLLEGNETDQIWQPDIYFLNEKEAQLHELLKPNVYTRIFPHGLVLQSYRLTLTLSCPMNLEYYPMDDQQCLIMMASYGWTNQDLQINWRHKRQLSVSRTGYHLPSFKLKSNYTERCDSDFGNYHQLDNTFNWTEENDHYSCIQLRLILRRRIGIFLFQIYLPCAMIVFVSWIAFWLDPSAIEVRMTIGITTMLTIVAQIYVSNQDSPSTSYLKASDRWTSFCQYAIFLAMLESTLSIYVAKYGWKRRVRKPASSESGQPAQSNNSPTEIDSNRKCLAEKVETVFEVLVFCLLPFIWLWRRIRSCLSKIGKNIAEFSSDHILSPINRKCSNSTSFTKFKEVAGDEIKKLLKNPKPEITSNSGCSSPPASMVSSDPVESDDITTMKVDPMEIYALNIAERIDKIAKIAFPLFFVIFNIYYWTKFYFSQRYLKMSLFNGPSSELVDITQGKLL